MSGSLYIVSTPIGNLKDVTKRSLEVLENVDLIAAEDTRITKRLLNHFEIKNTLISYNDYNENQKYHYYSTKTLLSRSKNNFDNHYHSVKLYHSTIINSGELEFNMWKNECINTIDKVDKTKDYRQNGKF